MSQINVENFLFPVLGFFLPRAPFPFTPALSAYTLSELWDATVTTACHRLLCPGDVAGCTWDAFPVSEPCRSVGQKLPQSGVNLRNYSWVWMFQAPAKLLRVRNCSLVLETSPSRKRNRQAEVGSGPRGDFEFAASS